MKPRNRRGAAAVEFAVTFPILLMLTFGIVEYGWLFHEYNTLHTALRDAVRSGSKNSNGIATVGAAAAQVQLLANLNHYGLCSSVVNCSYTATAGPVPNTIYASVTMPYEPISGFAVPGIPARVKAEIVWGIEP